MIKFKELIETDKLVLIDFWAEWCGPCRMLGPVIDQISDEYGDEALVGKVNAEKNPELTSEFGIRNLPTMVLFKNGEIVDRIVGAQPKEVIKTKMDSLMV